jgi:hypothetical protein
MLAIKILKLSFTNAPFNFGAAKLRKEIVFASKFGKKYFYSKSSQ